jgi:GT2 family glycosyltransferase
MLYILLPVHNRREITQRFLECLKRQTLQDFQLVLIDDGSTDDTDKMVVELLPETKIIYGNGNLWWAGGLQKGYELLSTMDLSPTDAVLLINDDTEFENDFLQIAMNILGRKRNVALKAWSVDKYSGERGDGYIVANLGNYTFNSTDNEKLANCTSTRGLFIGAKEFIDIGGFVPNKLPHYLSDYEFTIRAFNKGYKIYCDDRLGLISDSKESGHHIIEYQTFGEFMDKFFSIKCPANPKYLINFVRLTSSNIFTTAFNIVKIILKAVVKILVAFIFSFGRKSVDVSRFSSNFTKGAN